MRNCSYLIGGSGGALAQIIIIAGHLDRGAAESLPSGHVQLHLGQSIHECHVNEEERYEGADTITDPGGRPLCHGYGNPFVCPGG
jgi:hypothetical protein